jgi:lipoprotein-anchoring transpeptidase ErfK/SrfK
MGKDSTPTASGFYILGEQFAHMIMDSSTYGVPVNSPNGYRTEVDFATQMSYSGVFVHSAPWSVGAQGHTNTIGPPLSGTEGLGDWNIPWDQWHAGNAKA